MKRSTETTGMLDVSFDFQTEAGLNSRGEERDSDRYSSTLQEYHRILWSKPLPSGKMFTLTKVSGNRLYHFSDLGEYLLSSDWGAVTLSGSRFVKHFLTEVEPSRLRAFQKAVITIGARTVWPSNRVNGKSTINGAKGMNYLIADRLDLTIECIRRYYLGETSPLYETFKRYDDFFQLFEDFKGYIDFFLLQDYVSKDYISVNVSKPFDWFLSTPIPKNVEEYHSYMDTTSMLIKLRNQRIDKFARNHSPIIGSS